MKRIILFASGNGTNVQRIIEYFHSCDTARVAAIFCNNPNAFVIERAKNLNVQVRLFSREEFFQQDVILNEIKELNPDLIVLAGFLWLVPAKVIAAFPCKIINIHPALLPKYGGKGMYGAKVHEAVIASGDKESGITIHLVNEKFDEGKILFQAKCAVDINDTTDVLAAKIHRLEHEHYPVLIEKILLTGNSPI